MHQKLALTISALLLGSVLWLLVDIQFRRKINYDFHNYLVNTTTGEQIKPNELLDVRRVFRYEGDYINTTNAVDRLNDYVFQANMIQGFETDQRYSNERDLAVSGWPAADRAECDRHLRWIRARLSENANYAQLRGRLGLELTQLMDSFGRPQAGLFSGLVSWPGSYQRCLATTLHDNQIKTRYCWARLRFKSWPQVQPVRPQPRIRVGVCLPDTCDTSSLDAQRHHIEWLIKLDLNEFQRDQLDLDSMFCLPDERSPIRQIGVAGRVYIGVIAGWVVLVLIGTVGCEVNGRGKGNEDVEPPAGRCFEQQPRLMMSTQKYTPQQETSQTTASIMLQSLSIYNSIKAFKRHSAPSNDKLSRVNLRCLNSLKFLMTIMIVIAHGSYMTIRFTRTQSGKYELATSGTILNIMSVGRFVDTFFLLFGLLASYTLLKKFKVEQLVSPTAWLAYNMRIMIRLMPVYLPLFCFSKLVAPYIGHGPWWDYGANDRSLRGYCQSDSWWKIIPQFGFSGPNPGVCCVPTAWFLVVYTQLSLVLPPFVYAISQLSSNLARASLVLFVCVISSTAINLRLASQSTFDNDSFNIYGALLVDMVEKFESSGMMGTLGRAGTVAIGCYIGYLLRSYELDECYRWPKLLRSRISLLLAAASNVLVYLLPYIGKLISQHTNDKTTLLQFVLGNMILSFAWSISNAALIIMAVTTYRRTAVVRFFSHPIWHSANKLDLAIYLVHWEVLYMAVTGYEQGPPIGFLMDFWKLSAFGLVVSIPIAFAIYILFESPVVAFMSFIQRRVVELDDDLAMTNAKSAAKIQN